MLKLTCRLCKSKKLYQYLDLGMHPPSDQFKYKKQFNDKVIVYPLRLNLCLKCGFNQLNYVVYP